jgi:hypothetical protein
MGHAHSRCLSQRLKNQLGTPEKAASKSKEPIRSKSPSSAPQPGGGSAAPNRAPSAGAGKGLGEHPRWRKRADVVCAGACAGAGASAASELPVPVKETPRMLPQLPPAKASSGLLMPQPPHLAPRGKACVPARRATGARTGEPSQTARRGVARCAAKSCGSGRPHFDGGGGGSAGCWLLAAGWLRAAVESSRMQVGAKVRSRAMWLGG